MSERYFVISKTTVPGEKWMVQEYLNPAQAVHDFVRMGGLVDKSIIFGMEQPVSIRINNATVSFEQPKEDTLETKPEDKATES
jgi:hypothetical protein